MMRRKIVPLGWLALLCLIFVVGFWVARSQKSERSPNIVLITLDALRADHLGCYGYARNTSPNIDALAKKGTVFSDCIAPSSHTAPSNASLITSTNPNIHGVRDWGYNFAPHAPKTLAQLLNENGYSTALISDQSGLKLIGGFEKGFETFATERPTASSSRLKRISDITDQAITWLKGHKHKKFFLWLYYFSPHGPYAPPTPYSQMFTHDSLSKEMAGRRAPISSDASSQSPFGTIPKYLAPEGIEDVGFYISRYDGEIRRVDDEIGRLLKELKREGLDDNTIIVVNADHGEAMGEHDRFFCHANSLYDELVRVPLVVRWNDHFSSGVKIDRQVRTIDLMPTFLDIAGIKNSRMQGQSFLPFLMNKPADLPAIAYSEWLNLVSLRTKKWKLICDRNNMSYELYDLEKDPGEKENLVEKDPAVSNLLKSELDKYLHAPEAKSKPVRSDVAPEDQERLRSLGYAQ